MAKGKRHGFMVKGTSHEGKAKRSKAAKKGKKKSSKKSHK